MVLLESWKAFEESNGDSEHVASVQNMFPIVSKKRKVDETGQVVEGPIKLHSFSPYFSPLTVLI